MDPTILASQSTLSPSTLFPFHLQTEKPSLLPTQYPSPAPPSLTPTTNQTEKSSDPPSASDSHMDAVMVNTIIGSGRAAATDSPGLSGEIYNPIGLTLDATENFLYATDATSGGLIRKIALTYPSSSSRFQQQYDMKTVFGGVICNTCQYIAAGASGYLYVSSRAHNIKRLDVTKEWLSTYGGDLISGSSGYMSCSNIAVPNCYGNVDGLSTYARYNWISSMAVYVSDAGVDQYLFIADRQNNKIRQLELASGGFLSTTFASSVDSKSLTLQGLAVNSATGMLYAAVNSGVYSYSISAGASSKAIYAGKIDAVTGGRLMINE
jgi:hypothetical protein